MAAGKKSLYEILGLERDANSIDVGLAYDRRRNALKKAVPPDASEEALVQQAFEVLSNPKRRAAYDASLVTAEEKAAAAAQATTDLVIEPEPEPPPKNIVWAGIGAGLVVIAAALYFTFRTERAPAPAKAPPVEAPKPVVEAPPPPKPLPAATILAAATPSVGRLLSYDMGGQAKPLGMAVAIDRGAFLTTCHGIAAGSALVVRIGQESHSGSLAVADEALDLCRIAVPDLRGAGLATGDEPKAGDRIYVMGANAKGEMALTEGSVKQLRPTPAGNVLELSVPIAPGASGGPVFDTYGRLVALATTPHGFGAGVNVALPISWSAQMRTRVKAAR